ncbi:hypothetical protein L218DRAFT_960419 [Marasmius fiardii PR-910]|nr:hypothetical protein L218DRAFT_960419 [Marasmius fiardii PR-910]
MPSRHSRNGRKNKDNSDVVYQQPTPSSRSPNTRSIPLPELEENPATPFSATPPISTSPVVQEGHFEELANVRAALPTPPLVEVDGCGPEVEGQNQPEVVEREQSVVNSVAIGNEGQSLLDDSSGPTGAIEDTSEIQDVSLPSGVATGLIRPAVTQRSPSSSPAPVSTPAPTPERQTHVSSPRSKKAAVAKIPSPKSSIYSPTSSQTLAPHPMPVPTTATAAGVPSPPMVSRPVSFGQFTASSRRGEPTSTVEVDLDVDPMEGTIRPSSSRRRIPTRRPPEEAFDGQYQAHPNRRMSYPGRSYVELEENHYPHQHSRHGTDRQRSHSGISRAMGSGAVEMGREREMGDSIIWARWDLELRGRHLLFIGYYPFGIQIWDCTELDAVSEVLNLPLEKILESSSAPEFDLEYAGIIPPPSSRDSADSLKEFRPLVGILVSNTEKVPKSRSKSTTTQSSQLFVYSLSKHCIVRQVELPGLVVGGGKFAIGDRFLVVSTTIPPALHLLSSSTFDVLHKIPSSALIPFSHSPTGQSVLPTTSESGLSSRTSRRHSFWGTINPTSNEPYSNGSGIRYNTHGFHDNNHLYNDSVLLSSSTHLDPSSPILHLPPPQPTPVYSVYGRLLAYASSPNPGSGGDVYAQHSGLAMSPSLSSGAAALLSTGASTARSASIAALGSLSEQLAQLNRGGGGSGMSGGITQADLGNAAIKVGGGLLSGMKSLGGMAYKGAVSAASAAARSGSGGNGGAGDGMSSSRSGVSAFTNRFFSKSAPAAIVPGTVQRRYSVNAGERDGEESEGDEYGGKVSTAAQAAENGWSVTVLDLEPLLLSGTKDNLASPIVVTKFIGSRTQPIAEMWFSQDGNSIMVAPKDGQMVHVYSIRSIPITRILQQEGSQTTEEGGEDPSSAHKKRRSNSFVPDAPPLHVYDLRRGRTPGVVESASWSLDGRWAAFATRNRTVHVFAVNPYGGRSDVRSHLEGLVRNYSEIPPPTTDLQPLVRLRVTKYPSPDQLQVPLALTFLDSPWITESTMPLNLLPPMTSPSLVPSHPAVGSHSYGSASSAHTVFSSSSPSARSESMSPNSQPNGQRPKNYQDVLLFDPTDGVLSLRRVTVNAKIKAKDGNTSILGASLIGGSSVSNAAGHISRSLPGMGAVGKLAMSVSPTSQVRSTSSGTSQAMDVDVSELFGKESIVATWTLKRKREWSEVKEALEVPVRKVISKEKVGKADWLAQAELSTFSKSSRVLPRSIYLTHQFSFQALGEDYHALIRRYQFDIPGPKIEVRKGVEVSAYPTGIGESFVEAGGFRRDSRRLSSSFDEPLASAIAGELDYSPTQPILPMLPNGTPGSKPRSFKSSIPIKSLGDGMSESIIRFRREIKKVRSPKLIPSSDNSVSVSVPLEFDEEDEDFLLKEPNVSTTKEQSSETHEEPSARTVTPPTGKLDEEDTWVGGNDAAGIEDAETFDHISATGFFDEEQQVSTLEPSKVSRGKKGKKKQH